MNILYEDSRQIIRILVKSRYFVVKSVTVGTLADQITYPDVIAPDARTPEQEARIFDPFMQADCSTTRRYGGTGLGLAIVGALVKAMDGSVSVASSPGCGTRFGLTLMLEPASDRAEAAAPEAQPERPLAADLSALRVLAVDDNAVNRMVISALLAVVITYLLMASLFESFLYPAIIMLSVPTAMAGGVLGLALLNLLYFQPLDMLTLLGFTILVGIVVNNAILLVHQTLYYIRNDGAEVRDAIIEATRNRLRPIFMSTLTSVFGMLPLVLVPGAGSELYRGLGSVVVGGLSLSAVLTLLMVPPILAIFVSHKQTASHDLEPSTIKTAPV